MVNSLHVNADAANSYFQSRFSGYFLQSYSVDKEGILSFSLAPISDTVTCPRCSKPCSQFKDERQATLTDFDNLSGGPCLINIPRRRLRCTCGCRSVEPMPSWVLPEHRITKRLASYVQRLLRLRITIEDVSRITTIDWNLLKAIDKAALETEFNDVPIDDVEEMAVDEISIHKGHRYATVFMDLKNKRVFDVVEGKTQEATKPVFERLAAKHKTAPIKTVSVDMNAGFPKMVREYLPGALLAYDRFHLIQMFNRDVIVEAKKTSIRRLRERHNALRAEEKKAHANTYKKDVKLVRNAQWLIVTDPSLLTEGKQEKLQQLRENNRLFADLYPMTEKLRSIWETNVKKDAQQALAETIELCEAIAIEHNFAPIKKFAKMLRRRSDGIVNSALVKFGTNMLEGANNTAKVIKRIAYGYRDFEYFALKLKSAFPGEKAKSEKRSRFPQLIWNGMVETLLVPHLS